MGFQLLPKSMTLNYLEWCNAYYFLHILLNVAAFGANSIKVVEDRPILSGTKM